MYLTSLKLTHFRNYDSCDLDLTPGITVLVGPNAQGKTNLLESIFMLVLGDSFRTDTAADLIGAGANFVRIEGIVQKKDGPIKLELVLDGTQGGRISKRIKIEGVSHRTSDLIGRFHAVLFTPDDLNVITLSPGYRRKHLNTTLAQISKEYARALTEYDKVLRNRNKVLETVRDGAASRSELPFWDQQLVRTGAILIEHRFDLTHHYGVMVPNLYARLAGETVRCSLAYDACVADPKQAADQLAQKITANQDRDIAAGTTTSGPHRDDYTITLGDRPASEFGSRGEQRTAMLSLKLAEIEFIKERTGTTPVLLLDDVFSELDAERREHLLAIAQPEQTIITTTDASHVTGTVTMHRVHDGIVS